MPQDEPWLDDIESLIKDVVTGYQDLLSLWRVEVQTDKTMALTAASKTKQTVFKMEDKVDTGIYDVHLAPLSTNSFIMCLYFNLGFEGRVEHSKYTKSLSIKFFPLSQKQPFLIPCLFALNCPQSLIETA